MATDKENRYVARTTLLLDGYGSVEAGTYIDGSKLDPVRLGQLVAEGHLQRTDFDNAGNNPPDVELVLLRKENAELRKKLSDRDEEITAGESDEAAITDMVAASLAKALPDALKSIAPDTAGTATVQGFDEALAKALPDVLKNVLPDLLGDALAKKLPAALGAAAKKEDKAAKAVQMAGNKD